MFSTRSTVRRPVLPALLASGALAVTALAVGPAQAVTPTPTVAGRLVCGSPTKVLVTGANLVGGSSSSAPLAVSGDSNPVVSAETINVRVTSGAFSATVTFPTSVASRVGQPFEWDVAVNAHDNAGVFHLAAAQGPPVAHLKALPVVVRRGQIETLTLTGYKASEKIAVRISGRKAILGTAMAGRHGVATFRFRVATATSLGTHTVTARGETSHRVASGTIRVIR